MYFGAKISDYNGHQQLYPLKTVKIYDPPIRGGVESMAPSIRARIREGVEFMTPPPYQRGSRIYDPPTY